MTFAEKVGMANNELEARMLRRIDDLAGHYDPRMLALAKTKTEEAFMWLNRAVFQPARIPLPNDKGSAAGG